jgi:hypothetical protein
LLLLAASFAVQTTSLVVVPLICPALPCPQLRLVSAHLFTQPDTLTLGQTPPIPLLVSREHGRYLIFSSDLCQLLPVSIALNRQSYVFLFTVSGLCNRSAPLLPLLSTKPFGHQPVPSLVSWFPISNHPLPQQHPKSTFLLRTDLHSIFHPLRLLPSLFSVQLHCLLASEGAYGSPITGRCTLPGKGDIRGSTTDFAASRELPTGLELLQHLSTATNNIFFLKK